jgi:sterol desaturase/sphingolipid hydroxylase (fatty acid hydroxylase superfamily)
MRFIAAMDFPSPTRLAIPVFILGVALEWWAVKTGRARGRYETKDAIVSMLMGIGNVVADMLLAAVGLFLLMLAWPYRLFEIAVTWWSFLLVFLGYDFIYYWKHRFAHTVRWFWTEHVTHHSSTHYNLTTALRQPWFGPMTGLVLISTPLVLLGFHPAFIGFAAGVNLLYQFWIHTEVIGRMPRWFEWLLNSPSNHRVHHATNPRYLDANFAGVFMLWDRMFGSYVAERDDDKPVYGIVKPLGKFNPVIVAFHELGALLRDCWSDGVRPWRWIGRFTNPPGWSPDGNHSRSKELKAAWLVAHPEQAGQPGLPKKHANARSSEASRAPAE